MQIMRCYMAARVNEGAKVVAEGIARGPLEVALMYGDDCKVLADIESFAHEDALFWLPAPLAQAMGGRRPEIRQPQSR